MSALTDLRRLLGGGRTDRDDTGMVLEVVENGRVMVRTPRRVQACTTVVPVMVGDTVRVQGSLIVSRQQAPTKALPEFRV